MIFISFRHENNEHRQRVRALADRLVDDGVEVVSDELFLDENPGGPDEGWPQWCSDQVEAAERVLIVASPGWFESYEKDPLGNPGPGSACEAHVIRQLLYESKYVNKKFRLVSFGELEHSLVPSQLRAYHAYRADIESSFELMPQVAQRLAGIGLKRVGMAGFVTRAGVAICGQLSLERRICYDANPGIAASGNPRPRRKRARENRRYQPPDFMFAQIQLVGVWSPRFQRESQS